MSKGHWLSLLALLLKVALSYRHPKRTYPWFRFAYNYEQGVDSTSYEDFTADMPNRPFTFTELNMYPDSKEALFWNISYRFRLLLERESDLVINFKNSIDQRLEFVPEALKYRNTSNGESSNTIYIHDGNNFDGMWVWWRKRERAKVNLLGAINSQIADIRIYYNEYKQYYTL